MDVMGNVMIAQPFHQNPDSTSAVPSESALQPSKASLAIHGDKIPYENMKYSPELLKSTPGNITVSRKMEYEDFCSISNALGQKWNYKFVVETRSAKFFTEVHTASK